MKTKILLLAVFISLAGSTAYFGYKYFTSTRSLDESNEVKTPLFEKLLSKFEPSETTKDPISGKLKLLTVDLDLFTLNTEMWGGTPPVTKYYDAGVYNTGEFKGYKRIVAVQEPLGPGGPGGIPSYIFATKDNVNYVANGDPNDALKYPDDDYRNPLNGIDKTKVTRIADLNTVHPKTINLDKNYLLFRREIVAEMTDTGIKTKEGYDNYAPAIDTDFSKNPTLDLDNPFLTLYANISINNMDLDKLPLKNKIEFEIDFKYLSGTTQVYVLDSTGLPVTYSLTTAKNYQTYLQELKTEEWPSYPGLKFEGKELSTDESLYKLYNVAFPGACGGNVGTAVIKNVADSDFKSIGTLDGVTIYKLRDSNHPLYTLAYARKIDTYEDSFEYANPEISKPTFSQYVAKNPLLFFKDSWGRWIAVGEYDYQLVGGCGKPVVYLYPEIPTEVTVKFLSKMQLTTNIPTYHDGWKVKAYPNGELQDLQPQFTDCSKIEGTHKGLEYAPTACESNSYPYLYWSGNSVYNTYPKAKGGWIVSRDEVATFLDTKLVEMGLNLKERSDMEDFWIEHLLSQNAPFYRISFFQNAEMNELAPMDISPKPDTVYRIFLDYDVLSSKPELGELKPQNLQTLVRNGFTVVEWGGILK